MSDDQVTDKVNNNESGNASDAPVSNGQNGDSKPSSSKRKIAAKGSAKKGGAGGSGGAPKGEFKIGDVVLHRLKGFPPWPSIIVDPSSVPASVVSQKPANNPFIIMYFPDADYQFVSASQLTHLTPESARNYVAPENSAAKKKDGKLWKGYEIAIDPSKFMNDLAKRRAEGDDDEVPEDEDELAEDEEEAEAEPVAKKRKKPASTTTASKRESAKDKRAKLDKLAKSKKSQDTVEDEDEEEPVSKPKSAAKPKSTNAKKEKPAAEAAAPAPASAAAAEAKEDSGADKDPLAGDAEAQRVKDWRHKLQRAFLGKALPEADAMDHFDKLFKEIEEYDKMTVEYLTYTKIAKVMKRIAALEGVQRDDELKIRERAGKLNAGWQSIMNGKSATPAAESSKKDEPSSAAAPAPKSNGDAPAAAAAADAAAAPSAEEPMQVDEAPKEAANGEQAAAETSA